MPHETIGSAPTGTSRPVLNTALWTGIAEWFPRTANAAVTIFVAWKLGPVDFGTFALSTAIVQMCWLAVDLGTGSYGLRQVARDPANHAQTLAELVTLNAAIAVSVTAGVVIVAMFAIHAPSLRLSVLAMSPFLVSYAAFPDWYLRGRGQLRSLAVSNGAAAAVLVFGSLLASLANTPPAYGLAWAVSPAGSAVVFWLGSRRISRNHISNVSARAWYRHLSTSLLFATAGGLTGAGPTIVIFGMAATAPPPVLGAFALGLRIAQTAITAYWLFLQNLLPRLIRLSGSANPIKTVSVSAAAGAAILLAGVTVIYLGVNLFTTPYNHWLIWVVAGFAVIAPWTAKASTEILLVSRNMDRARIWVGAASLAGSLISVLAAAVVGIAGVIPAIVICCETAAAGLGLWLLIASSTKPPRATPLAARNV